MARRTITHVVMFDVNREMWIRLNEGTQRPMARYANKTTAKKDARRWAANKAKAGQPISLVIMTKNQQVERQTMYN